MNIFALSEHPQIAAHQHVDKHVVKMILEYCQLLSTAHRLLDGTQMVVLSKSGRKQKVWTLPDSRDERLYRATHVNHPSAVWCRENHLRYNWLWTLLFALCEEYTYRYGKVHKCQKTGLVDVLANVPAKIKISADFSYPTPAMPDECKVPGDVIASYRNYYNMKKQAIASWRGKVASRNTPDWFVRNHGVTSEVGQ